MPKIKPLPKYERIVELFSYDPEDGILRWKVKRGHRLPGMIAGTLSKNGYLFVRVDDRLCLVHRIIWLFMTGIDPDFIIDHKDTCGTNNKWKNLRQATLEKNGANSRLSKRNTSGFKGIYLQVASGKWCAIRQNQKN